MVNNKLICNFPKSATLNDVIREKLSNYNKFDFVVGYFGLPTLSEHEAEILNQIKNNDSSYRLILGLAHWEGLSEKSITKLESFHRNVQSLDPDSGVWIITENKFHGKFYLFGDSSSYREAIIGSSNFSRAGLSTNYEVNLHTNEQHILSQLIDIKERLLKTSYPIGKHDLTIKGVSKKSYKVLQETDHALKDIQRIKPDRAPDFSIPIRADQKTQRSNLNLHFGSGRKKADGIFIPRPFFEIEITLKKDFWTTSGASDFVSNQNKKVEFDVATDTGEVFTCNFHRKTSSKTDARPLHENSAEFQSTPREALGKYLKGKLINHNCLKYGEPVTEETLECYGSSQIKAWKTSPSSLYLSF
ncbi:NgoFVII family restriction endonuclease [Planctomycetota bacterium]|nr:NgoFVII family restriction endonuclease [Planctomycetota bacterium]